VGLRFDIGHVAISVVPANLEVSGLYLLPRYRNVTAHLRQGYDFDNLPDLFSSHGSEQKLEESLMKRIVFFLYGCVCYLIFFSTFIYAIAFIGNLIVPRTLDAAPSTLIGEAVAMDVALLMLFALQHSIMARRWFKEFWTEIVPQPLERSTYVLFSSLALIVLFVRWQPIGGVIWSVEDPMGRLILRSLFAFGCALVLVSTFLINHFDLFGLRQVWLYLLGRPYSALPFATPGLYRMVRHPLYVGWLFVFWMTPTMTIAHLLFSVATTAYILVAIQFEERDLIRSHGALYREYKRTVPMLVPFGTRK
jgi:methanethiol S-methyltransferase